MVTPTWSKTLTAGPSSTSPFYLTPVGNSLFFTNSSLSALYVSDGTDAGTVQVPTGTASVFQEFAAMGGKLYFNASTSGQQNLWVSDGTALGTSPGDYVRHSDQFQSTDE